MLGLLPARREEEEEEEEEEGEEREKSEVKRKNSIPSPMVGRSIAGQKWCRGIQREGEKAR